MKNVKNSKNMEAIAEMLSNCVEEHETLDSLGVLSNGSLVGTAGSVVSTAPESSAIAATVYSPNDRILFIQFTSSTMLYQYDNVPASEWVKLITAESIGGYYNAHIRDNYYWNKVAA